MSPQPDYRFLQVNILFQYYYEREHESILIFQNEQTGSTYIRCDYIPVLDSVLTVTNNSRQMSRRAKMFIELRKSSTKPICLGIN